MHDLGFGLDHAYSSDLATFRFIPEYVYVVIGRKSDRPEKPALSGQT